MSFKDLRDFIDHLEGIGQLKRISHPVDPDYEMTEISDRTLRAGGPALPGIDKQNTPSAIREAGSPQSIVASALQG